MRRYVSGSLTERVCGQVVGDWVGGCQTGGQVQMRSTRARPYFLGDLRWIARFGLMSQIGASQIEAPIGSLFQKNVNSTFMVKMRIDLGS